MNTLTMVQNKMYAMKTLVVGCRGRGGWNSVKWIYHKWWLNQFEYGTKFQHKTKLCTNNRQLKTKDRKKYLNEQDGSPEQWNRLQMAQFDPAKLQAEMQKPFFIKLLISNIISQNDTYWTDSEW